MPETDIPGFGNEIGMYLLLECLSTAKLGIWIILGVTLMKSIY